MRVVGHRPGCKFARRNARAFLLAVLGVDQGGFTFINYWVAIDLLNNELLSLLGAGKFHCRRHIVQDGL